MKRLTERTLKAGLEELAARDGDIARGLAEAGYPALRRRQPGFATLLRIIVGQQVSIAAAATIWGRFEAAADPLTPEGVHALDDAALRQVGLSRQKMAYARGLAADILEGRLRLDGLGALADGDAAAELTKVKGIGRWSAEIYLLFALGRPDAWPADDLALVVATQRLKGLAERPDRKAMDALAEDWRPWRGAVAHLLWRYYRQGGV